MKLLSTQDDILEGAKGFIAAMSIDQFRAKFSNPEVGSCAVFKTDADGTRWLVLAQDSMWPRFKTLTDATNAVSLWAVNPYVLPDGHCQKYSMVDPITATVSEDWKNAEALICTVYRESKVELSNKPIGDSFQKREGNILWVNRDNL